MNHLSSSSTCRRIRSFATLLLNLTTTTTAGRLFSTQSRLSSPINHRTKWPPPKPNPKPFQSKSTPPQFQNPKSPNFDSSPDFTTLSNLLTNPSLEPDPELENALNQARVEPRPDLLLQIFNHFDSSPKPLYIFYLWAEKQPGFKFSLAVFNALINLLGKAREFNRAWALIHDKINASEERPNFDSFVIMIRRFARAGLPSQAIQTYEFASNLAFHQASDSEQKLFEILLDSLCKEGLVRVAYKCLKNRRGQDTSWVPYIRIYNILLNGWFRSRNLKQAEQFWMEMKRENIKPSIVTYGTLVEGYCRMGHVEVAMGLIAEMKREGVEPNAIVYNPVIDALGEAGRFKEALGMMEQFLVLVSGPTISTYNSLVKGFCKAGDLEGASKIIKMMINRGFVPSVTTYNYFFRHFSKSGKIDEGLNLYAKITDSGYAPDRLTYHLLVKMLCVHGKLDLSMQVVKEMRASGCDLDLATSTMLIHLLVKTQHVDMAFEEFEDMIRRGLVPQYLTYQKMSFELRKQGKLKMAQKISDLMSSVPHSKKLPNTYGAHEELSHARKKTIMKKAVVMSDVLKTYSNPRKLVKHRYLPKSGVSRAGR
ncbi:uncharacterized protein [Coffea arabica]|uniref:Pentatricopeptide repeat-containing protein At5g11310, mitochondrial-like n=1 Tax=Coffea arabica TaxID=13443 RepID=A0A6P6TQU0_COFAR